MTGETKEYPKHDERFCRALEEVLHKLESGDLESHSVPFTRVTVDVARVLSKYNVSREALAKAVNVTPSTVVAWETGDLLPSGAEESLLAGILTDPYIAKKYLGGDITGGKEAARVNLLPPLPQYMKDFFKSLTGNRRHILEALQLGRSDKEIAKELGISVSSIRQHMSFLHGRTGARSRVELAIMYSQFLSSLTVVEYINSYAISSTSSEG